MNRYPLDSYPLAEQRMREQGYIFDVGQISPSVIDQLRVGMQLGIIKASYDSWPLRGLPGGERRRVYELINRKPLVPPLS